MSLPVDFETKARQPKSATGGGYPVQLSAADLMKNFVYAAGEFKEEEFEVTDSKGKNSQHTTRKISLKNSLVGTNQGNIPAWNTALNNNLGGWQMVPAPTKQGALLFWNKNANNNLGGWELVTATKAGEFLYWDKNANGGSGGWSPHTPGAYGSLIYYDSDAEKWQNITPGENSIIYYRNKAWTILTPPVSGTHVLGSVDGTWQFIATEECE